MLLARGHNTFMIKPSSALASHLMHVAPGDILVGMVPRLGVCVGVGTVVGATKGGDSGCRPLRSASTCTAGRVRGDHDLHVAVLPCAAAFSCIQLLAQCAVWCVWAVIDTSSVWLSLCLQHEARVSLALTTGTVTA